MRFILYAASPLNHALFWEVGGGGGGQFCDIAKVVIDPDEDLAKFGYMLNKKIIFLYIRL
jgi:hypothetical protein